MIGAAKAYLKRHWPRLRLRTILLATLLFVASLPGVGAVFLRVYENTLVRQTESELIAQGAALVAAIEPGWPGAKPPPPRRLRPEEYRPEEPRIDLNDSPVLPERPEPGRPGTAADPEARAVARGAAPVLMRTALTTLASIQLLDRSGMIVTGALAGGDYSALPEVRAALGGRAETVLRANGSYRSKYPLEWLSRASAIRIHHVRPIRSGDRVVGALLLSRSPRALFRGIYEDLGKILVGIAAIFATLVVLSGLLSRGIARPIEELSKATRGLALGRGEVPEPPPTAAIEIQALYRDFAEMAEAIDRRSRYLRDFAHAVSHEFKTPLAGIRGGIELLQDHLGTMNQADRERFLANVSADADRLSRLVTRLLQLARADMARPDPDAMTPPATLLQLLSRLERPRLNIRSDMPHGLPTLAVPATTVEAALSSIADNSAQAGASELQISARVAGGMVEIDLIDDGPGVPASDEARVFEPFFTSRRSAGGTGLGLPIVRSLLDASRASIELVPSRGGAHIRMRLPIG